VKVKFIPLDRPRTRSPTVIADLPVILTRASRRGLSPAAHVVSPCHCQIENEDGLLVVRDFNSRHGTFVNECRVTRAYLWPGDKLTVGLTSYLVEYERSRVFWGRDGELSLLANGSGTADARAVRLPGFQGGVCSPVERQ
jgi:pSer/pThr/pTyr-binding forkhead associated (FHA) protein